MSQALKCDCCGDMVERKNATDWIILNAYVDKSIDTELLGTCDICLICWQQSAKLGSICWEEGVGWDQETHAFSNDDEF